LFPFGTVYELFGQLTLSGSHVANISRIFSRPKGVSFLSRLLPNNKSKTRSSEDLEDESEATDQRPEGMDAQLFSYTGDNIGFNPRYPHPPNYIKVRAKYKKEREFDRLFLAQELRPALKRKRDSVDVEKTKGAVHVSNGAHPNAIWALEFSMDGKYLAAGGQDKVISVWTVLSTPEERRTYEKEEEDEANGNENAQRLRAPVFQRKVFREYTGHEAAVMDLNWSKVRDSSSFLQLNPFSLRADRLSRTVFCCRRLWTNLYDYGTLPGRNASVSSNTMNLFSP